MTTQVVPTVLSHARIGRITGSRIPGILGISPYWTRDEVLREMVREFHWAEPEFNGNFITEFGKEHEADAIAEYELTRGVRVHAIGGDQVTLIHPQIDFLAYTPDGLVGETKIVEAKCPWRSAYTHIDQRPDYRAQILLGKAVTGRPEADFLVWRQEGLTVSPVDDDAEAWLESVYDELERFLDEYRAAIADPEISALHLEPLVDVRDDEDWRMAALEYLEARWAAGVASTAEDAAKAKLVKLAGDKTTKGCGVHAIKTKGRAGSVSYKDALAKFAPEVTPDDLEPFRGNGGAPSWTIRRTGDK